MENYNCWERLEYFNTKLRNNEEVNGVELASAVNNCSDFRVKYANCSACKRDIINKFNIVYQIWVEKQKNQ
jgi:hypothetical protein